MKTHTVTTWTFDELDAEAKEKAIERYRFINVETDWWDSVYYDAKDVGIVIKSFNIDRGQNVECTIDDVEECAAKIIANHGETCETFKTATQYLAERGILVGKYSDGVDTDCVAEGFEYDFDNDCDELDKEFVRDISEDYRMILSKEYDYLIADDAVIEILTANEFDFAADGKIYG